MDSRSEITQHDRGSSSLWLRPQAVTRSLGWLSIALGVAELIAPRAVSRGTGLGDTAGLVRLYGLRELACGIGILASGNPRPFLWGRVAGDVMDLATLAAARNGEGNESRLKTRALVNVAAVTALDVYAAKACESDGKAAGSSRRWSAADADRYESRTGFPRTPDEMRGAALADFAVPHDMRPPDALRPYATRTDADAEGGQSSG
jgi:hypothetical protein